MRRAFDLGVTHFDLANNYGPPYGAAEANVGRILAADFAAYRDELVISTKAGYDMWPGPYGDLGSRKYLLASLDQSLQRLGLDYVDIFYSPPPGPRHPAGGDDGGAGLRRPGRQGAVRRHLLLLAASTRLGRPRILRDLGTPLLIHQPSYSMFNRWIETTGCSTCSRPRAIGCIAFSPLAQGLLTDRYLDGIPADSRAATGEAARPRHAHRRAPGPRPGTRPRSPTGAARPWPSSPWPGCCATRA